MVTMRVAEMASTDTSTGHTYREMKLQHGRRGIFLPLSLTSLSGDYVAAFVLFLLTPLSDMMIYKALLHVGRVPRLRTCRPATQALSDVILLKCFQPKYFLISRDNSPSERLGTKVSEAQRSFKFCRRRKSSEWEGIICKSSVLGLWLCPVSNIHPSIGIMENGDKTLTCLEIINNNI